MKRSIFKTLVLFVFCFGALKLLNAQTGSITGEVVDPSGAVIPNAQINAVSTLTGLSYNVTSTSAGVYSLPVLPPSTYDITASATGFEAQTKKGVVLTVAATIPLNFTLVVAGATTTVSVVDATPNIPETKSYSLSTVVDSKQINDLPLILRDPYQLVLLSPGAVSAANNDGGFAINGQRDRNNNFMLDGTDNNDTSVPGIPTGISSANPDSAQEFRVITNNFDAEFGRNTGAIIDVVTRSGTNAFHGDAYEFGRYNALGARDFFNRKADGPQDPYVRNDFGASVGGPIWKDHSFFFLNGEVQRFRTTRTAYQTTPNQAFRNGVFTFIDPYAGSTTDVDLTSDPATNPDNYSGLGQDPTVKNVLAIAPIGQIDNGDGVSTTYLFPSPDPLNSYQLTGRFDHQLTDKHSLTVRYVYGHSNEADPFHDEVLPGYGSTAVIATGHNGSIALTSLITPRMTNLLKGGYNLNNAGFFCDHSGLDQVAGTDSFGNGRDIDIPYFFTFGCVDLGDSNGQARLSSTLFLADTVNLNLGAHSIKFGGEFRSVKDSNYDNFYSRNLLSLNEYTTYGPDFPSYNYSSPDSPLLPTFEDLVWGATGAVANSWEYQFFNKAGTRQPNDLTRFVQHEFGLFVQDSWRMSSRFTLTAGLRYEFNGVPYEAGGNFSNFYGDASAPLPSVGYFTFTTVGPGTGRQLYKNSWLMFEPRVGFAWDLKGDGKTAVRGGFGIFHDRIFDNLFGNAKSNPPFQALWNDYPYTGDSSTPTVTMYPNPSTLTASPNITDGDFNEPITIDPNLKMPTSLSWNLGIQRQVANGVMAEVNFVGNHGTHGLRDVDGAPPQPALVQQYLNQGINPEALTFDALYTGDYINGTFGPSVYNTAFYHDLIQTSQVNSNYSSLQASIRGTFGGALLMGSYTYGHSLDNGSDPITPGAGGSGLPRNSFDLGPEYGNSDFDVKQRGVISATYSLPVGRGQHYMNNGVVGAIFEGIQISGIESAQTGLPFDLRGSHDNLHTGLTNRPELVGQDYPSNRGQITALGKITGPNRSAFDNAPYGQSVSIHRNKYHGPGYVDTDAVFQKTQTLHESLKLQFRAEFYNLLNHPNMASPASGTITSPYFGISASQVGQNDGTTGARQIQGALKVLF